MTLNKNNTTTTTYICMTSTCTQWHARYRLISSNLWKRHHTETTNLKNVLIFCLQMYSLYIVQLVFYATIVQKVININSYTSTLQLFQDMPFNDMVTQWKASLSSVKIICSKTCFYCCKCFVLKEKGPKVFQFQAQFRLFYIIIQCTSFYNRSK